MCTMRPRRCGACGRNRTRPRPCTPTSAAGRAGPNQANWPFSGSDHLLGCGASATSRTSSCGLACSSCRVMAGCSAEAEEPPSAATASSWAACSCPSVAAAAASSGRPPLCCSHCAARCSVKPVPLLACTPAFRSAASWRSCARSPSAAPPAAACRAGRQIWQCRHFSRGAAGKQQQVSRAAREGQPASLNPAPSTHLLVRGSCRLGNHCLQLSRQRRPLRLCQQLLQAAVLQQGQHVRGASQKLAPHENLGHGALPCGGLDLAQHLRADGCKQVVGGCIEAVAAAPVALQWSAGSHPATLTALQGGVILRAGCAPTVG